MEDQREERKLSLNALFFISGISCLFFTLVMWLLDGITLQVFYKAGITCTSVGVLLFAFKYAISLLPERKKARNTQQ